MEGGRQAEVAKAILGAKNVPYFVAAPMLIQDLNSWEQNGMQGLQVLCGRGGGGEGIAAALVMISRCPHFGGAVRGEIPAGTAPAALPALHDAGEGAVFLLTVGSR